MMFWNFLVINCILASSKSESVIKKLGNICKMNEIEVKFLDNPQILEEYDFIVVGSGPAGSALANRLTEILDWDVLLLEAGTEGTALNDIPLLNPIVTSTNYNWGFKTEPQTNSCLGSKGQMCLLPTGRGIGGGSIINGMVWARGNPNDYDSWADEGNTKWSYQKVLPYFLKSEHMTIPELRKSPYHSTGGPINIEYPYPSKLIERFLKAGKELGYEIVDHNDEKTPIGFSRAQAAIKNGKRQSAATAYLFPIKNRPNFHVSKNSLVSKILIDPKSKCVKGVVYIKNGIEKTVYVRKEVILSAGALNSPQLLMLSGIGHKDHLNKLNITVIQDLPVGDNLQEHVSTFGITFFINTTDSLNVNNILLELLPKFHKWVNCGEGIFANNGAEGIAYINTSANSTKPNIEFVFVPIIIAPDDPIIRSYFKFKDGKYFPTSSYAFSAEGWSILPEGMYPKSRGNVRLRSSDVKDSPQVNANLLTHPDDVRVIIEGIKAAIKLSETSPFQEIGSRLHSVPVKECEQFKFGTDEYWECAVRTITFPSHHLCCTCKMGKNPATSVVDENLRVHGVQGLRVADASIMPNLPSAHTMAPCYMIGEKAAGLIKDEWKGKYSID